MESKDLNEEGCLQWRCILWKPLSGQPLKKTLWIRVKDCSDYSQGLNHWCYFLNNNQWCFTFHSRKKKDLRSTFFPAFMNAPSTRFFVTNFLLGAMILLENACCTFSRNNFCLKTLAALHLNAGLAFIFPYVDSNDLKWTRLAWI